jgi:hypothetical protein
LLWERPFVDQNAELRQTSNVPGSIGMTMI